MIRRLSFDEFQHLYQTYIRADFPRMERRPLRSIRRLYRQGRYVCLVLEEEGQMAAYASFICDDGVASVFLDYYAVAQSRRGGGVGSRFLAQLPAQWPGKAGILLECERPDTARGAQERETRRRRIAFYLRGGAQMTRLLWRAFGVDYNILWLPIGRPAGPAMARDLVALYALSLPKAARVFCTRLRAKKD